jgi:hypothetical protein
MDMKIQLSAISRQLSAWTDVGSRFLLLPQYRFSNVSVASARAALAES